MATTKISVTVDSDMLSRIKRFLPDNFNLSAILNEALREQLHRHEALALLDEMDRELPISEAGQSAGEKLWQVIESSSTLAPSPPLRTVRKRSALQREKR